MGRRERKESGRRKQEGRKMWGERRERMGRREEREGRYEERDERRGRGESREGEEERKGEGRGLKERKRGIRGAVVSGERRGRGGKERERWEGEEREGAVDHTRELMCTLLLPKLQVIELFGPGCSAIT